MHPLKLTRTGARRLEKTAAFLCKLPPEKFDLSIFREERECGTVACVVGWTPWIFPQLIKHIPGRGISFNGGAPGFSEPAAELFEIPLSAALSLFNPGRQWGVSIELPICGPCATPKQVARMLRKFIAIYK